MNFTEDNLEFLDNFISYDEDVQLPNERITNFGFSFDSPDSGETDSTGLFANQFQPHNNDNFRIRDDFADTLSMSNGETARRNEPFIIVKPTQRDVSCSNSIDIKEEVVDTGINPKSKRIGKREKAKERTKAKKESFLDTVDSKYIPEGFNDPNLDEQTRKKMIQMIRNRVSAQNSRDKKKSHLIELETMKLKLTKELEKATNKCSKMYNDFKKLEEAYNRVLQENEELKKSANFTCGHCGRYQSEVVSSENDMTSATHEENSDISSPRMTRNSNFSRSFFSYAFAFATILSLVLTVSMTGYNGNFTGISRNGVKETRMLAERSYNHNKIQLLAENNTINNTMLRLKNDFQENLPKLILDPKENITFNKVAEEKKKNAVVDLSFYNKKFLGKANKQSIPTVQMLEETSEQEGKQSTLFCPNAFQLITVEEKKDMESDGIIVAPTIETTQYLQVIIPKANLHLAYMNENASEFAAPVVTEDDGTLLELWCNVLYVRELASNI